MDKIAFDLGSRDKLSYLTASYSFYRGVAVRYYFRRLLFIGSLAGLLRLVVHGVEVAPLAFFAGVIIWVPSWWCRPSRAMAQAATRSRVQSPSGFSEGAQCVHYGRTELLATDASLTVAGPKIAVTVPWDQVLPPVRAHGGLILRAKCLTDSLLAFVPDRELGSSESQVFEERCRSSAGTGPVPRSNPPAPPPHANAILSWVWTATVADQSGILRWRLGRFPREVGTLLAELFLPIGMGVVAIGPFMSPRGRSGTLECLALLTAVFFFYTVFLGRHEMAVLLGRGRMLSRMRRAGTVHLLSSQVVLAFYPEEIRVTHPAVGLQRAFRITGNEICNMLPDGLLLADNTEPCSVIGLLPARIFRNYSDMRSSRSKVERLLRR